jgi:spore maturation protein SpmB
MKLDIESLKQVGAFTGRPVEREITWKIGDNEYTATVYVRPLSYQTAIQDLKSLTGKSDGIAGRIAASICNETGKPVFTVADITGDADPDRGALDGNLTMALLTVIGEVNGAGKQKAS